MSLVIGLDLSSTSTGVCEEGSTSTIAPPERTLHKRCRTIAWTIGADIHNMEPDLVVVEALGTRRVRTAIALATVHALVLDVLAIPAVLKKWATGKGNANKDRMLATAIRAGFNGDSNDEADAWWLWTLGKATLGEWVVGETVYRGEVLAGMEGVTA